MREIITLILLISGASFMLIAAVGVVRMPDLLMRMHAATKAGTLGAGLVLSSVAVAFDDFGITMRSIATIAFLALTAPVAAHMIGRAAYRVGITLWHGTKVDELRARLGEDEPAVHASEETERAQVDDRG